MFERLIIATDLSPEAYAVLNCLGGLKAYGAKECLLLQCLPIQETASSLRTFASGVLEQNLQGQKGILEQQGYTVKTRVVQGLAKNEINRIAVEENYSVMVVGARSHTMTSEAFLGNLAYDLIHHAQKPVLIIRLEDNPDGLSCVKTIGCDISNHVLVPTDFSDNAELAFQYVKKMVADGAKKVTLLHVQDKAFLSLFLAEQLETYDDMDNDRLRNMKRILQEQGKTEVEAILSYGSPSVEILNTVHERNIQLIVMGSQGRGFVKEFFLGSVSHNIARHSAASVLLIPAKRENELV